MVKRKMTRTKKQLAIAFASKDNTMAKRRIYLRKDSE
jgi:hypothetical protein